MGLVEGTYQGAQSYFDQILTNVYKYTGCTYNILQSNQLALLYHINFSIELFLR
jgi:hypothetical protein